MSLKRKNNKSLGLLEVVAIAIGGMVGGGIFTVLGISVSMVGMLTPVAILLGGVIALMAGYSYAKLGSYYLDEGASFSFFKRTYPSSHFAPSVIGWLVIFGYISTLALYAYTFSSYAISGFSFANDIWIRKGIAIGIIAVFSGINVWSVKGMGKIEDVIVYTKLAVMFAISVVLILFGAPNFSNFMSTLSQDAGKSGILNLLIVSALTFVAYEGFQMVNNAVKEMRNPKKNVSRAIYLAILVVMLIYLVIALGAVLAIPAKDIIQNQEYALAAGAGKIMGSLGSGLVILGAVLATSSAISGTLFGASRQIEVVSECGYLPKRLSNKRRQIPVNGILIMAGISSLLILIGGLDLILEFGSITFLLVSFLMALANFRIRKQTHSSPVLTIAALLFLAFYSGLIIYYEFTQALTQMLLIVGLYILVTLGAFLYAKKAHRDHPICTNSGEPPDSENQ